MHIGGIIDYHSVERSYRNSIFIDYKGKRHPSIRIEYDLGLGVFLELPWCNGPYPQAICYSFASRVVSITGNKGMASRGGYLGWLLPPLKSCKFSLLQKRGRYWTDRDMWVFWTLPPVSSL